MADEDFSVYHCPTVHKHYSKCGPQSLTNWRSSCSRSYGSLIDDHSFRLQWHSQYTFFATKLQCWQNCLSNYRSSQSMLYSNPFNSGMDKCYHLLCIHCYNPCNHGVHRCHQLRLRSLRSPRTANVDRWSQKPKEKIKISKCTQITHSVARPQCQQS